SPIDYDDAALESTRSACATLRNRLRAGSGTDAGLRDAVIAALDEDFNTPEDLALLFTAPADAADTVAEVLDVLGLGGLAHDEPAPPGAARLRRVRPAAGRAGRARVGGARRRRRVRALPARWLTSSTGAGRCARRCGGGARWGRCGAPPASRGRSTGCRAAPARRRPRRSRSGRGAPTTRASWPRSPTI